MKILILNYEFPPLGGGGGIASYDLAKEWAIHGQVDVITSSFRGLSPVDIMDNINVHRVNVLLRKSRDAASFISMLTYLPGAFIKGIRLIRKNRYDVINTHFAIPSGPVGYLLGKIFGIPNVLSLHGGDIYDPSKKMSPHNSWFFSRAVRFILNRADRIVAQSSNTRDNTIKYYNPKKNVEIIPLAFHPPKDVKDTRIELELSANDFVLITIGRIVKRKAMDVLIKALGKISDKNIKLVIMGDGPDRGELERLAREQKVNDRIKFLGYVDDDKKFAYLKNADLFTLTSMHEGFGIVYMEAMHYGLPIICTNEGGQTDFLSNRENAILINVGDFEACAEAIKTFRDNKNLYKKCSQNNIKKIKNFYAPQVAEQYIKVFKVLIGKKKQ